MASSSSSTQQANLTSDTASTTSRTVSSKEPRLELSAEMSEKKEEATKATEGDSTTGKSGSGEQTDLASAVARARAMAARLGQGNAQSKQPSASSTGSATQSGTKDSASTQKTTRNQPSTSGTSEKRRSNWSAEDLSSLSEGKSDKFLKLAGAGKKAKKLSSNDGENATNSAKSRGADYYQSQREALERQFMSGLQYGRGSRGLGR